MDSEQWGAFEELGRAARAGLWPADITIEGSDYTVSLTTDGARAVGVEGGTVEDQGIAFELAKEDHPTEPELGDAVEWEGNTYSITEVEGQYSSDPAWFVRAELWEQ